MKIRKTRLIFSLCGLIFFAISCDTTRNVYASSPSKTNHLTIKAVTLSHCGCTHLYADNVKNGRKDFQIFYNDNLARKSIYNYDNSKTPIDTFVLRATEANDFLIPFDSIDIEIFERINTFATQKPPGIVYSIKAKNYKGYIKDSLYNR